MKREEYRKKLSRIIGDESKVIELMIDLDNVIKHDLPPAEGAKTEEACGTCKWQYAKFEYKCEDCRAGKNNYEPDQPTAEGAEEILRQPKYNSLKNLTLICEAMDEFATLHAQKIADKMVSERLREELIKFLKWDLDGMYENMTDEMIIDEYLKSRDSHE